MQLRIPFTRSTSILISASRAAAAARLVPAMAIERLVPSPATLLLSNLDVSNGETTLLERILLAHLARMTSARVVFEMGTFHGKTAADIALNLGPEAQIYTLDLPASHLDKAVWKVGAKDQQFVSKPQSGKLCANFSNVTQLYGDTAKFDYTPWLGRCDFVFVDACHSYEYATNDTRWALRLVCDKGIIAWHDYGSWPGVTDALNNLYRTEPQLRGLKHIAGTSLCFCQVEHAIPAWK